MGRGLRAALIWGVLAVVIAVPLGLAANSPLLAFRQPVYVVAGFAGIAGLALMLLQPLLAGGLLPGIAPGIARRVHRLVGVLLLIAVVLHVAGLWLFSPPDVIDALLFVSPTPFSAWGVIAMWAAFAAGLFALFRHRMRLRFWRIGHTSLVAVAVGGTVAHALLIEGTMETMSKVALCILVVAALARVVLMRGAWKRGSRPRAAEAVDHRG